MEDDLRRENTSSSDEMFSFPGTPSDGGEFEFGSITPTSPFPHNSKASPSPADQFFLNGRLLPHSFPATQLSDHQKSTKNSTTDQNSRTTSRTSSVSSKDSLMSSRSNSTNSRSSTCSSARTSSSEASEKRMLRKLESTKERIVGNNNKKMLLGQSYQFGSSQRWQFISPVPVLGPSRSRRRRSSMSSVEFGGKMSPIKKEGEEKGGSGFLQRFLRSFVKSCKACHAMDMEECVVGDLELEGESKLEVK